MWRDWIELSDIFWNEIWIALANRANSMDLNWQWNHTTLTLSVILLLLQYSDNYYRAALIEAIAATVTPAITTVSVTGSVMYLCLFSLCVSVVLTFVIFISAVFSLGVNRVTYWSQSVVSLPHKCQPPSPLLDNIWVMVIVWRLRGNIIRTARCWVVWHNVHSQQHTHMSSSYRSSRLGLSHWDPYAMHRGGLPRVVLL